jgi:hypothetical protein
MSEAIKLFRYSIFPLAILVSSVLAQESGQSQAPTSSPPTVPQVPAAIGKGHVQFVNATGRDGGLVFSVNGEPLSRRGYVSGQASGPMEVGDLPLKVVASLSAFEDAEVQFVVKPDHLHLIVAKIELEEKKDKPPTEKLAISLFEIPPGKTTSTSTLLAIQMTNVPQLNIGFGGQDLTLNNGDSKIIDVNNSAGFFPGIVFRHTLLGTLNYREPNQKAVVLFTDKAGGIRMATFSTILH